MTILQTRYVRSRPLITRYYQIECQQCDEIVAAQFEHQHATTSLTLLRLQCCPLCQSRHLQRTLIRRERYEELMNTWDLMESGETTTAEDTLVSMVDLSHYLKNLD